MVLQKNIKDQVLTWRLNRPERGNALGVTITSALKKEMGLLKTSFEEWKSNKKSSTKIPCRVLVLEAELGGRKKDIWIAGGDLKELKELDSPAKGKQYAMDLAELCNDMEQLPIPVIAKIDGAAIGGGAELALAADLRLGCDTTRFEFKQLAVGLATGYASSHRLIHTVGLAAAKNLLFRQLVLSGPQCVSIGLLNEIYASKDLLDKSLQQICLQLTNLNADSLDAQKEMLRVATTASYEESQQFDHNRFEDLWMSPPHKKFLNDFSNRS